MVCVRRDCSVAESYRRVYAGSDKQTAGETSHQGQVPQHGKKREGTSRKERDLKGFSTGHDITRARQCGQGSWERTV